MHAAAAQGLQAAAQGLQAAAQGLQAAAQGLHAAAQGLQALLETAHGLQALFETAQGLQPGLATAQGLQGLQGLQAAIAGFTENAVSGTSKVAAPAARTIGTTAVVKRKDLRTGIFSTPRLTEFDIFLFGPVNRDRPSRCKLTNDFPFRFKTLVNTS